MKSKNNSYTRFEHLICLKIGGSVITDKVEPFKINQQNINIFAENFRRIYEAYGHESHFLVGNGAGSFGHFTAYDYGLANGATTSEQFYGACLTHFNVKRLNGIVARALLNRKMPVFQLSPGDMFLADNKKIIKYNLALLRSLLANGCYPLLHGDIVCDRLKGISIYSTGESLLWLGQQLRHEYQKVTIISVTDTGGVLDADGQVISQLKSDQKIDINNVNSHDVTGGIVHKVAALRNAYWADAAYIVGNSYTELDLAINHKPAGTRILFK